jgi:hypothetical protein
MVRSQTEILLLHQEIATKMKNFMAAAFLLGFFSPHHAVAKKKNVDGEIDVALAINCIFDADGKPLDEPKGETVSETCADGFARKISEGTSRRTMTGTMTISSL